MGDWGSVPPKSEAGRRPMHASVLPSILRTTVIGCEANHEPTKRRLSVGKWVVK